MVWPWLCGCVTAWQCRRAVVVLCGSVFTWRRVFVAVGLSRRTDVLAGRCVVVCASGLVTECVYVRLCHWADVCVKGAMWRC